MKILIGADIVPTGTNENYFENAQMEQILEKPLYDLIKCILRVTRSMFTDK